LPKFWFLGCDANSYLTFDWFLSLNKMFERLTAEPYLSKYSVEILSSPETDDPWVITMENVVSEVEAARVRKIILHPVFFISLSI
jgi:hypothetical protein